MSSCEVQTTNGKQGKSRLGSSIFFRPADKPLFSSFASYVQPPVSTRFSTPPQPQAKANEQAQTQSPPQSPPQSQTQPDLPPDLLSDLLLIDTNNPEAEASTQRKDSVVSTSPNGSRRDSAGQQSLQPDPSPGMSRELARARSLGISPGVVFERRGSGPAPTDEDIIIVTVRLSNKFRKSSVSGADDLPSRPPARGFLRRMSTRLNMDHAAEKEERYKAIKMPRGDYKRYFARDRDGNYAGTEPEREWDEEEVKQAYGEYQDMPIHHIL